MTRATLQICLVPLIALCACSGNQQLRQPAPSTPSQQQETGGYEYAGTGGSMPFEAIALPASPQELAAQLPAERSASYTEEDLLRHGMEFNSSLGSNNVQADGSNAKFEASWSAPDNLTLEDLAYCIYSFNVTDYDREPLLRYRWETAPADISTCWLGLGDFTANRWQWFPAALTGLLYFSDIEPYTSETDTMLVVVLQTNAETTSLSGIRVGEHGLVASLQAAPASGLTPLITTLDARASYFPVGGASHCQWDTDLDGTYDEDTGASLTLETSYADTGEHIARVRIEDEYGFLAEQTTTLNVYEPWIHSWGVPHDDTFNVIKANDEAIYAAGAVRRGEPAADNLVLIKLDLNGNVLWAKEWGGAKWDRAADLALAADGSIYLAGITQTYAFGLSDVLLQRWDSDGNLVWSKTWGEADFDDANSVVVDGASIYVSGDTSSFSDFDDALLLKYDQDGNLVWARTCGGTSYESVNGMCLTRWIGFPPERRIHLTGSLLADAKTNVLYARFTDGGTLVELAYWNLYDEQSGFDIVSVDILGHNTLIGGYIDSVNYDGLLLEPKLGEPHSAVLWQGSGTDTIWQMVRYADGYFAAGGTTSGADSQGDAFLMDISPELEIRSCTTLNCGRIEGFRSMGLFPYQGIIAGGFTRDVLDPQWESLSLPAFTTSGTWTELEIPAGTPTGVTGTTPIETVDVMDSVIDEGAGSSDMLIAAFKLPEE